MHQEDQVLIRERSLGDDTRKQDFTMLGFPTKRKEKKSEKKYTREKSKYFIKEMPLFSGQTKRLCEGKLNRQLVND